MRVREEGQHGRRRPHRHIHCAFDDARGTQCCWALLTLLTPPTLLTPSLHVGTPQLLAAVLTAAAGSVGALSGVTKS